MSHPIDELARRAVEQLHRDNSDNALQSAIELMLTDRSTINVIRALRAWADYLEERI